MKKISVDLNENVTYMNQLLSVNVSFDIIGRKLLIGEKEAYFYFIDGFCKDETMQKMLQYFLSIKKEEMPGDANMMSIRCMPYVEVDLEDQFDKIITGLLSGVFILFIDGYSKAILMDSRTYPARNVSEPDKDKVLRGSKDGFVETVVFNTALIRRRIRSTDLRMEMTRAGNSSQTDIAICYMDGRVEKSILDKIKKRISEIKVDALTMNQESLAECLYKRKWFNPFPKFKYTERPDTAAAHILDGHIVLLIDNSPSAMILPATLFDILDEADDYYFPPVTGTYLRLTRFLISILTFIMTPTFLLLMNHREYIPEGFQFIILKESENIPLLLQFLILELAIDGLKLAAVNTPNMLSTPLSVMAALVLGEFSVKSGWFNAEVMLYMAFVAIANYTQSNYELGYALKFLRIIALVLTASFGLWGYIGGIILYVFSIVFNKTITKQSYIDPLIPFRPKQLLRKIFRLRLPDSNK